MKQSAPNRWRYGGVIQSFEWESGAAELRLWNGTVADVGPGDRVLVLCTGQRAVSFVGVEKRQGDACTA